MDALLSCQSACSARQRASLMTGKRAVCRQEIEKILRCLPAKEGRQNVMFSATYPSNIQELASFALKPQRQLVDTVGEEQTHAAEQVGCSLMPVPGTVSPCTVQSAICSKASRPDKQPLWRIMSAVCQ